MNTRPHVTARPDDFVRLLADQAEVLVFRVEQVLNECEHLEAIRSIASVEITAYPSASSLELAAPEMAV